MGLHGGLQLLEMYLTPVACHPLPSLFWPTFYEVIVRWFGYLESPPPDYTGRGWVREGGPPLKEQSLHELTLHTNWTHVLLLPPKPLTSLFYFLFPYLGVTCVPLMLVTDPCLLSGPFIFVVRLSYCYSPTVLCPSGCSPGECPPL